MRLFCCTVAIVAIAAPAWAAPPKLWERYDAWTIFSSHTDAGVFETCFLQRLYPDGKAIIFYDDGTVKTLAFFLDPETLDAQPRRPVTLHGDATPPIATYAVAGDDPRSIALELEISPHLAGWTAGRSLHLEIGTEVVAFPVAGVRPALECLALCALKNRREPLR